MEEGVTSSASLEACGRECVNAAGVHSKVLKMHLLY